ncbi:hypothetical protein DFAR_2810015 [Desulfarculales bacterium]
MLTAQDGDILMTLRPEDHHNWRLVQEAELAWRGDRDKERLYAGCKAFMILRWSAPTEGPQSRRVVPFVLGGQTVEINFYQDWWICEKLLTSKRVLFVTQGKARLRLGHVYRYLRLAHEISTYYEVLFLCISQSEIDASRIASFDYQTILQGGALARQVIALDSDLVTNDILDTSAEYVDACRQTGIKVVNFKDSGPGAQEADLVFNALYEDSPSTRPNLRTGHQFFCLRDEFENARRQPPASAVREILITFGGTNPNYFTSQTLDTLLAPARSRGIRLSRVAGPGYQHKSALLAQLERLDDPGIGVHDGIHIISSMIKCTALVISSAERTVLELMHLQKLCIMISHHAREHTHSFARPKNNVVYLGAMELFKAAKLRRIFLALLDQSLRQKFFERMQRFDFSKNKKQILSEIWSLISAPTAPAAKSEKA